MLVLAPVLLRLIVYVLGAVELDGQRAHAPLLLLAFVGLFMRLERQLDRSAIIHAHPLPNVQAFHLSKGYQIVLPKGVVIPNFKAQVTFEVPILRYLDLLN